MNKTVIIALALWPLVAAGQAPTPIPIPGGPLGGTITGGTISGTDVSGANVTATGSTVARSLAARAADVFNVRDYGAVCNGSADDTTAFQAALTAIQSATYGGTLYIPAGDCELSGRLTATIGAFQRLIIRSDEMHGARLHWTNGASAGVTIAVSSISQWLPFGPSVAAENLTLVADWTGTYGTAISVVQSDPGAGTYVRTPYPSVSLRNITWMGSAGTGSWLTGAYLFGNNITNVENILFWGRTGDTTSTMLQYDTDSNNPVVVDHSIINPRMHGGGTGIQIGNGTTTNNLEGFDIYRPSFTGNAVGINIENTTGGVSVIGGQINVTSCGICAVSATSVYVNSVDFIEAGATHISVNGGQARIIGNTFLSPGGSAQVAIGLANMVGANTGGSIISGNEFSNFANAPISLTGTTDYVHVAGNINVASALLVNDTTGNGHNTSQANSIGGVLQSLTIGQPKASGIPKLAFYSSGNATEDGSILISGGNSSTDQGTLNFYGALSVFRTSVQISNDYELVPTLQESPISSGTIPNYFSLYVYAPGTTTASLTLTLPSYARPNLNLKIVFADPVTSLTISPNSGQTIYGATVLSAAQSTSLEYVYVGTTWYRIQ